MGATASAAPFQCNTCGASVTTVPYEALEREGGQCPRCGSTVRIRALTHLLSLALQGRSVPTVDWVPTRKTVYGVSDWPGFAAYLHRVCRYTNTQFDRDAFPDATFLDITVPAEGFIGKADALLCSDVLEHVSPPVQRAFDGLFSMLQPGGTLVFTVPYSLEETVEHFPDLYAWKLVELRGTPVLVNRTRSGMIETFEGLVFHGGGKAVLEMRLFGLKSLLVHLAAAGFVDVTVMPDDVLQYGIRLEPWSRAITARRPLTEQPS